MAKQLRLNDKERAWVEARRRHRLSDAQVQMARELGMNPKKLGKIDNHKQEPWKAPLPVFIEQCYFRRFGRVRPERVHSIEQRAVEAQRKKQERRGDASHARLESGADALPLFAPWGERTP
jgi:hypothetical protein